MRQRVQRRFRAALFPVRSLWHYVIRMDWDHERYRREQLDAGRTTGTRGKPAGDR